MQRRAIVIEGLEIMTVTGQTQSIGGCSAQRRAKGGMRAVFSYDPSCSEEEWNNLFSISIADEKLFCELQEKVFSSGFRKWAFKQQE